MSTILRGTRLRGPELPTGRLALQPPPRLEPAEGSGAILMNAIPMLGSLGSIVLVATMAGPDAGGRHYLAAGLFLFATLGFVAVQVDRQRKQRGRQVTGTRTDYLGYLSNVRRLVREAADQQREALTWHHPDPAALAALAEEGSRVWERDVTDPRFLDVRWGLCHQPLALELVPPEGTPGDQADPVAASALRRLVAVHRLQPDLPASVDLRGFATVEICGLGEPTRALARAVVCAVTAFQSPDHLVVAVLAARRHLAHWDWVKWLPHAHSARSSDAVGPRRMVSTSFAELTSLLPADLAARPRFGAEERPAVSHVVLVLDGVPLPPGNPVIPDEGVHGLTVLALRESGDELNSSTWLRLELDEESLADGRHPARARRLHEETVQGKADRCSVAQAEAFARRLAARRTLGAAAADGAASESRGDADLMGLLALGDVRTFDPDVAWGSRPARDRLRVPIGTADSGAPVVLDLKEPAQQGMGPHGLVIGSTGSGKSELLRTLVLGLALTHPPEQLNLVLVDFKGGATFAGMSDLPHVSALITNLAEELTLVERMQDALSGELVRRQELLRAAGDLASVRDYEKARGVEGSRLAPLPSLLVVVDEFSEMLAAKPEFADLFATIGRLGRSLGLHLLLASQRLDEGRLRGLESHLSYRVGLRTFSAQESRSVLGVPDAYELPAVPGLGYLKPDPTTLVRFRAAYVSGPAPGRVRPRRPRGELRGILPFTVAEVRGPGVAPPEEVPVTAVAAEEHSLLDLAVARLAGRGPSAHQVWLPPLDAPDTLDRLMPDLTADPRLGLVTQEWRRLGPLTVPLGTVDRPREQRRDTLTVDLSGSAGHVAVVGGPLSGKSTLLRTIVTSLALTSTPQETQFYVLDLGGGAFAPLTGLPHVAGVATRSEPDVVSRIVAELRGVADTREAHFRRTGIDSIQSYRLRRAEADDGYGDVFLVVDGWSTLRSDFPDLEATLQQLAGRGLGLGLHLVAAAARWSDFRAAMRDVFGTRLELRLGDPADSEIDRQAAGLVPTGRPGRGLAQSKLHFLGALPRIDGVGSAADLGAGLDGLVTRVREAWAGPPGPRLRLLPARVDLGQVRALAGPPVDRLVLGIGEQDLAPVVLASDHEPHLLVLGDSGSGKTGVLRTLAREIFRTRTPAEAQILLVDYRRTLLGEVPGDYLLDHVTSAAQAAPALREVAAHLEQRLPGSGVTPEQLRDRSWWSGAELFVLVDDYDLVATQQGSPVAALQPLLAQARDVGLHLVVARRSGGAARASYEPVVQSLRELAMPGLMLSGSPEEGPLLGGHRPGPAPPGRGLLVTRDRGAEVVQVAWSEPTV